MWTVKATRRTGLAAGTLLGLLMVAASGASASVMLCVPEGRNLAILTPNAKGQCTNTVSSRYKVQELGTTLSKAEQEELKELRKYVSVIGSGVNGKPTVRVAGANVQIVNGEGKTATLNGEGNLVIGYDEQEHCSSPEYVTKPECEESPEKWITTTSQTGSHNLVLGEIQTFTSYGAIIGGRFNTDRGPEGAVLGSFNIASGGRASVSGGRDNTASGQDSSVLGGVLNTASGDFSSVGGGEEVNAAGEHEFMP